MIGLCKHFNGVGNTPPCLKGIDIRELVGGPDLGWVTRLPCIKRNKNPIPCDQFEDFTQEELQAIEDDFKEIEDMFETVQPVIDKIKIDHRNKNWEGIVECPICKGTLHITHVAINGHTCGKCETKECISWME